MLGTMNLKFIEAKLCADNVTMTAHAEWENLLKTPPSLYEHVYVT
jgi:hypothetical protein